MDRRTDILEKAYDIIGTDGLEAMHARTVAKALGINHATVHYYFPKRADLLKGVAEFTLAIFEDDRAMYRQGAKSPDQMVKAEIDLAEAYSKKSSRFVKVLAGLYVASLGMPELKKAVRPVWTAWTKALSAGTDGKKAKRTTAMSDPNVLASTLFGACLAAHLLDTGFKSGPVFEAVRVDLK